MLRDGDPDADRQALPPQRQRKGEARGPIEEAAGISASRSAATQRAYASDQRHFETWCASAAFVSLPATLAVIASYLTALADDGAKVSTIERRVTTIGRIHRLTGHESPCTHPEVRAALARIRGALGTVRTKKAALTVDVLRKVLRRIPDDLAGIRDRALMLMGFAGALRRSELVALDIADVERRQKGVVLTVPSGMEKTIMNGRRLRPVAALDEWLAELAARGVADGPLFRPVHGSAILPQRLCDKQVARIVKKRVAAAGLDPALFAAQSLRSGALSPQVADVHGSAAAIQGARHEPLEPGRVPSDATRPDDSSAVIDKVAAPEAGKPDARPAAKEGSADAACAARPDLVVRAADAGPPLDGKPDNAPPSRP